jgi:neurofibromin 1
LSNSSGDFHAKFHGVFREGLLLPQTQDRYNSAQVLASTEALAILLADVVSLAAPTINLANAWRSRWMSLVASTAFQTNIAIQPRAFTVMGCLAREDVDDDLLYQVLVALKSTINGYTDERDNELLVSIITALSKMMEKLPTTSRYGLQLFWLALAVVRFAPVALFNCSVLFLEAVLLNISASGDFKAGRMALTLLQGRTSLEDTADLLDAHYGIHFSIDSLHFAICATVGKGLTDSATRSTSLKVLKTFLEITSASGVEGNAFPDDMTCLPYLYLTVFRVTTSEEARSILWVSGIKTEASLPANLSSLVDLNAIKDKELLLTAAIGLIDFTYMPESARAHYLNSLNELVEARPAVMFHLCEPLFRVLEEVLLNSHDARTLHAAQKLFCTLGNNPESLDRVHMSQLLADELDDLGFEGLWSSARFSGSIADERVPVQFTEKLISAIVS